MDRHAYVAAALLVSGIAVHPVNAQDVGEQLDAVLRELDEMRRERTEMRAEIDTLKSQLDEDWMTEARAEEIRAIVEEVLVDADLRASLLDGGMTAGWNEHFFLESTDGRFKLEIDGLIQSRWAWNYHGSDVDDDHINGFELARTHLTFRGHVFNPDITYLVRGGFGREGAGGTDGLGVPSGGEFDLLDAFVRFRFDERWSLRTGQFKLPYNREELVWPGYQLAVERTLVNESHNLGRSQGIEITYAQPAWHISTAYSDGADDQLGGFGTLGGTTPENTPFLVREAEWSLTSRVEGLIAGTWDQFRDFTSPVGEEFGLMVGLAGHIQKTEFGLTGDEIDRMGWTADVSAEFGGANLFGAFYHTYADHPTFGTFNVYAFTLQGGIFVAPKFEAFARFEYDRWDADAFMPEDLYLGTIGLNWYIDGHDLKLTTDLSWGFNEIDTSEDSSLAGFRVDRAGEDPQVVFRTQLQLMF